MPHFFYLDDSGDPGLTGAEGSSSHFALAMVQLVDTQPISALTEVRQKFHFKPDFEFKYYTLRREIKEAFFHAIRAVPFRVRIAVADKARLEPRWRKLTGQKVLLEMTAGLIMRADPLDMADDVLIVDGATRAFCRALRVRLSEECRRVARVRPLGKITGGKSDREDGLQMADMLAGTARQHGAGENSPYYPLFAHKVVDWWSLPEGENKTPPTIL